MCIPTHGFYTQFMPSRSLCQLLGAHTFALCSFLDESAFSAAAGGERRARKGARSMGIDWGRPARGCRQPLKSEAHRHLRATSLRWPRTRTPHSARGESPLHFTDCTRPSRHPHCRNLHFEADLLNRVNFPCVVLSLSISRRARAHHNK